jgi:hypothetical protein
MELEKWITAEAVGDRELRGALSYVLARARPVTADEVASSQGTHRNVARSRLERLADAVLLVRGHQRRTALVDAAWTSNERAGASTMATDSACFCGFCRLTVCD